MFDDEISHIRPNVSEATGEVSLSLSETLMAERERLLKWEPKFFQDRSGEFYLANFIRQQRQSIPQSSGELS